MRFADPYSNIRQFGLEEGMHVADFGSGSGHYTNAAAEIVGDEGKVYAIDIQQELLKKVKNLSRDEDRKIIEVIWGDITRPQGTKLADSLVDAVIVSNVLFQLSDVEGALAEAHRVLKSKGRLLLIEWSESFGGIGPHPENIISKERARALFEAGGFVFDREITEPGAHHYGLVFSKS